MNRLFVLVLIPVVLASTAAVGAKPSRADEDRSRLDPVVVIHLEGVINYYQWEYVDQKIDKARDLGARAIILEIDSPGGEVAASLAIADRLLNLQDIRTVAYVPREALSGAAFAALGCDEIVMHPRARLGDAGPVVIGADAAFRHAPEKLVSDLALRIRQLAEARDRPAVLAEAMVDRSLVVYRVTPADGQSSYVSQEDYEANKEQWKDAERVTESRKDRFLEVEGTRAVELGLAEATVADRQELLARYGVTRPLREMKFGTVETTVAVLNHPLVTGLLLVIALVALFVELSAPGIGVGGLLSGLCVSLFFWSRFLGGTSGWLEVVLFVAGVVFLAMEFLVIPGFGVAGVTGILLMLASIVMASQDFVVPHDQAQWKTLGVSMLTLMGTLVAVGVSLAVLSRYYDKVPILGNLVLTPPTFEPVAAAGKELDKSAIAGSPAEGGEGIGEVRVGDWGIAESLLRPAGKAVFGDRYVDVVADGSFVESGKQVRVVSISGNRIVVREIT